MNRRIRRFERRRLLTVAGGALLVTLLIFITLPYLPLLNAVALDAADQLRRLGPWAIGASILFMVLQAVIAPLPSSLIAAANGAVFGIWWGSLLSWSGAMAGALLTYAIGRRLGAHAARRWENSSAWRRYAAIGAEHGFWIVLMARLTPIISLDFIGYLAGAWRMPWREYLLANAIGIAPGMIIYTVIGHDLLYAEDAAWRIGAAGLALIALLLVGRRFFLRRRATATAEEAEATGAC